MSEEQEPQFAVLAEVEARSKPLILTHLTFARLMDDVVVPYDSGDPFFIDGVPVKRDQLKRIKIIQTKTSFAFYFDQFHHFLRNADPPIQKIYGEQYHIRLDALLRDGGEDVTSQVIKAFNAKIKPSLKDYLPKREELIKAAFQVFVESIRALGGG